MKKFRIACAAATLCLCMVASAQKKYPQPIIAENADVFGYAYDRDKKQLVLNYIYESAGEFEASVGQAIVGLNGHYAVIDVGGNEILEAIYDDIIFNPDHQTYTVTVNGKSGVIDSQGHLVLPIKFDNLGATTKGWYEGMLDGEWIYAASDGRVTSDMSEYLKWREASQTE